MSGKGYDGQYLYEKQIKFSFVSSAVQRWHCSSLWKLSQFSSVWPTPVQLQKSSGIRCKYKMKLRRDFLELQCSKQCTRILYILQSRPTCNRAKIFSNFPMYRTFGVTCRFRQYLECNRQIDENIQCSA